MARRPHEPRPSDRAADWGRALSDGDMPLLRELVAQDDPGAALLEMETFVNGIYRSRQIAHSLSAIVPDLAPSEDEVSAKVAPVLPFIEEIREGLGWQVRDFDLALLRLIRRSSALSAVLGAGVSVAAGAPSWPDLVRILLERTLEKGLELREPVPAADNPATPPVEVSPDGSVRITGTGTWSVEYRVRETKRYTEEQAALARGVLAELRAKGNATDAETLKAGAQVCHDLCGQHLFRLVTGAIYARARGPSEIHRAVAALAHAQSVPGRGAGPYPGWSSIITYNFDALMSEALADEGIPHVARMPVREGAGFDPDRRARESPWHVPVYHLHGYTPRRLFRLTGVRFVFATSQYLEAYGGAAPAFLDEVFEDFLAMPVQIALYVGCSFSDEAMNDLLRRAFLRFPGRHHYALLRWPHERKGVEPDAAQMRAAVAKYLAMGVRPVWFDDFAELPGMIRRLQ